MKKLTRITTAIILAGGLGTRIKKIYPDLPKPVIPVAGKPFLFWLVEYLIGQGIKEIFVSTGYLADKIEKAFINNNFKKIKISFIREDESLGTGGAVRLAAQSIDADQTFVCNGDTICHAQLSDIEKTVIETGCSVAVLISKLENVLSYGSVIIDDTNRITSFSEKNTSVKHGWVNAGIYCVDTQWARSLVDDIPLSMEKDVFPSILSDKIRAVKTDKPFIDIGSEEGLRNAEKFFMML